MPGIRIKHERARSGTFIAEQMHRKYHSPFECFACSSALRTPVVHHVKTYHLALDGQGFAIVSQEIWTQLQTIPGNAGFSLANHVEQPPDQSVNLTAGPPRIILPGEIAHG